MNDTMEMKYFQSKGLALATKGFKSVGQNG